MTVRLKPRSQCLDKCDCWWRWAIKFYNKLDFPVKKLHFNLLILLWLPDPLFFIPIWKDGQSNIGRLVPNFLLFRLFKISLKKPTLLHLSFINLCIIMMMIDDEEKHLRMLRNNKNNCLAFLSRSSIAFIIMTMNVVNMHLINHNKHAFLPTEYTPWN
jgi:hypothetical protein